MCKDTTSENTRDDDAQKQPDEESAAHATDAVQVEEAASVTTAAPTTKGAGNDDDAATTPAERFPWWRGGGTKPRTGRDLGVFDTSLEDRASCVSLWAMSYLNPMLSLGSRKVLDAGDVGVPSQQDRAERAYQGAKKAWEDQVRKCDAQNEQIRAQHAAKLSKCTTDEQRAKVKEPPPAKEPSIAASLVASFGAWKIVVAILYQVIAAMLSFVPVIILKDLVGYFEWYNAGLDAKEYTSIVPPWVSVVGLGVIPVVVSALQARHNGIMAHCGVFVRTAVSTMLYRKALTVSAAGRAKTSTGQVVNMMSNGAYI